HIRWALPSVLHACPPVHPPGPTQTADWPGVHAVEVSDTEASDLDEMSATEPPQAAASRRPFSTTTKRTPSLCMIDGGLASGSLHRTPPLRDRLRHERDQLAWSRPGSVDGYALSALRVRRRAADRWPLFRHHVRLIGRRDSQALYSAWAR